MLRRGNVAFEYCPALPATGPVAMENRSSESNALRTRPEPSTTNREDADRPLPSAAARPFRAVSRNVLFRLRIKLCNQKSGEKKLNLPGYEWAID
ncbi:hypothetical protein [Aureimonas endophytica]|uniref:hypothetical protein n=1 Tax=Aureimonas endophytica TaxID=2027858 RepID=UPI00166EAE85|nr:hypothetical protein [Aureimonas endophytica]